MYRFITCFGIGYKYSILKIEPVTVLTRDELEAKEGSSDIEAFASPAQESTTIVVLFLFLVLVDPYAHQTQRTCKASKSIFLICLICKTDRSALWVRIPRPKIEELAFQAQGEGIFSFAEIPVRIFPSIFVSQSLGSVHSLSFCFDFTSNCI